MKKLIEFVVIIGCVAIGVALMNVFRHQLSDDVICTETIYDTVVVKDVYYDTTYVNIFMDERIEEIMFMTLEDVEFSEFVDGEMRKYGYLGLEELATFASDNAMTERDALRMMRDKYKNLWLTELGAMMSNEIWRN